MNKPYNALKSFLKKYDVSFEEDLQEKTLTFSYGNDCDLTYELRVETDNLVSCVARYPVKVPEARRSAGAEWICRANYGLVMGKFDLRYKCGAVIFFTSSLFGRKLDQKTIARVLCENIGWAEKFLPSFLNMVHTDISPADVLGDLELLHDPDRFPKEDKAHWFWRNNRRWSG